MHTRGNSLLSFIFLFSSGLIVPSLIPSHLLTLHDYFALSIYFALSLSFPLCGPHGKRRCASWLALHRPYEDVATLLNLLPLLEVAALLLQLLSHQCYVAAASTHCCPATDLKSAAGAVPAMSLIAGPPLIS